jgi:putative transposase
MGSNPSIPPIGNSTQQSVFPSNTALLKTLFLTTFEATKKWTMPIRNWAQVYGKWGSMYEGRLTE